jgi:hypothetical protein
LDFEGELKKSPWNFIVPVKNPYMAVVLLKNKFKSSYLYLVSNK